MHSEAYIFKNFLQNMVQQSLAYLGFQ